MLPVFAITAAVIGVLALLFLISREVGDDGDGTAKPALAAAGVLALVVGIWQVIAQLPGAGSGH
jgi:hypothetical protein